MARLRDDIGTRMKNFYEQIPKTKLMRRCPVAIRIDGKAFHTYTRNFKRPFDSVFMRAMQETMKYLCENIQGCVLGYTQSDEITLILVDYEKINSSAWFELRGTEALLRIRLHGHDEVQSGICQTGAGG